MVVVGTVIIGVDPNCEARSLLSCDNMCFVLVDGTQSPAKKRGAPWRAPNNLVAFTQLDVGFGPWRTRAVNAISWEASHRSTVVPTAITKLEVPAEPSKTHLALMYSGGANGLVTPSTLVGSQTPVAGANHSWMGG